MVDVLSFFVALFLKLVCRVSSILKGFYKKYKIQIEFSAFDFSLGLANLSLSTNHPPANIHGQQNTYHHDQNYTKMSSPPINGTYASPGMNNGISQPPVSLQPKNYYTPFAHGHLSMPNNGANQTSPVPGSMTPPVYSVHQNAHHISHASSMPNLQHFTEDTNAYSENPQGSHTPLFNINSPFQTFSTVGETSTAFSKSTDSAHVGRPLFCLSSQANQPVVKNPANDVHDYHRTTSLDTMRQPSPGILTEQVLMNKTMPSLSPSSILESTHVRSNSVPDIMPFTDGKSTPPASLGAPPTEGYYTRSLSPNASRNKTPSPTLKEGDVPNNDKMQAPSDYENHYNVMDQLNFALDKCSATLEKKVYDDVKRKLDILESQLRTNSLSKNVTDKMASLATGMSFIALPKFLSSSKLEKSQTKTTIDFNLYCVFQFIPQ